MIASPVVEQIAEQFDATVESIEGAKIPNDWPSLEGITEGELWVSGDLAALTHPRSEWCKDWKGNPRPFYARDLTQVDQVRGHDLRVYRRLDQDWYAWLYRGTKRARKHLEKAPQIWQPMAARFNALWAIAGQWWGEGRAVLHRPHYVAADYRAPVANPGTVERFKARAS